VNGPATAGQRPVIWSIAGLDTAGGAGLSADQRAADAMDVHLCPVAAALTAQHSLGVDAVFPVPAAQLHTQLQALARDLPPRAIKTGLLGSVEAIERVAHWVDHFRALTPAGVDPHRQLALIVDPVLGASACGSPFGSEAVLEAYRRLLLPRTTVLTPNRAEARRLLGLPGRHEGPFGEVPDLAERLMALGPRSALVTGGDAIDSLERDQVASHCLDWLATPQAEGWLCAPRLPTPHHHGTGCTLAAGIASALALGHVEADAIVLAHMLTRHALAHGHAAGQGAGPVKARAGFASGPAHGGAALPWLGLGRELPWVLSQAAAPAAGQGQRALFLPFSPPPDGLYGILPDGARVADAVQAGLRCVQLRHKASAGIGPELQLSLDAAARAGAQLFVNDHWREALTATPADEPAQGHRLGLHLGQEDLLALTPPERARLLAERGRLMLGLSSHSLWELTRALGCGASYVACGPVLATTTKDMPWRPQGERNLRWWVAHSPVPVVAIGGLLGPDELARFASCRPAALCVVRGLGSDLASMQARLPALRQACAELSLGAASPGRKGLALPHPVL